MITFHFHLQPQYKNELFHINFTTSRKVQNCKENLFSNSWVSAVVRNKLPQLLCHPVSRGLDLFCHRDSKSFTYVFKKGIFANLLSFRDIYGHLHILTEINSLLGHQGSRTRLASSSVHSDPSISKIGHCLV